jgi:hypothetical protein
MQLLAMLSTGGQRPRFHQPTPAAVQPGVSLHRCGDVLAVRAASSADAVRILDDASVLASIAPAWLRAYHSARHRGRWPKPGDVVVVNGHPAWQRADDGYHRIPPDQRARVRVLVDPRSWRDTLCPLDAVLEHGRRLPGLVTIELEHGSFDAVHLALTDPASRPRHDATLRFVARQAIAAQRRRGRPDRGVTLRLDHSSLRDICRALLDAATAYEHHPRTPSPSHADALRGMLRGIQTQAAAQTLDPPAVRGPADVDLSW